MLLRQVEEDGDRSQLGENDDPRCIGGLDDIAFIDQANARAPGDGCDHVGVGEDGPRIVDGGLVELELGFELGDHRFLRVELLFVDSIGDSQPGVTLEIKAGICELCFVLRLLRDGLVVCSLVGDRVDLGQHVPLVDVLPFPERNLDELAVHLGAYRDRIERLCGAYAVEIDGNIGQFCRGREHRDRIARGGCTPLAALGAALELPRLLRLRHVVDAHHGGDNQAGDQRTGSASLEAHCANRPRACTPGGNQPPPSA